MRVLRKSVRQADARRSATRSSCRTRRRSVAMRRGNVACNELGKARACWPLAARFRAGRGLCHLHQHSSGRSAGAARPSRVVLRLMGVVPHHREIAAGKLAVLPLAVALSLRACGLHAKTAAIPRPLLPKLLRARHALDGAAEWLRRDALPAEQEQACYPDGEAVSARGRSCCFSAGSSPTRAASNSSTPSLAVLERACPTAPTFVARRRRALCGAEMEARVKAAGLSARVQLYRLAAACRGQPTMLDAADIYVSTNMYGNLSNANLEALAAGACLVAADLRSGDAARHGDRQARSRPTSPRAMTAARFRPRSPRRLSELLRVAGGDRPPPRPHGRARARTDQAVVASRSQRISRS